MLYPFILFFIFLLVMPFSIAQIMPNRKWLIGYSICFATLAFLLYHNHLTTPIERRGNGVVYFFANAAACLFYTSGIVGIINRTIVLYLRLKGYRINIWMTLGLFFIDSILVVFIFILLLENY